MNIVNWSVLTTNMVPLRVGICIIEQTRGKLMLPKLLQDLCKDGSMEFIVIDMNRSLKSQGPFDVIIHKVLEWFNLGYDVGNAKLIKLLNYVGSCGIMPKVIDPIEETVRLADRFYSLQILKDCQFVKNDIRVFVPNFTFLKKTDSENIIELIKKLGMHFPIITKAPVTRCDMEAHDMAIIFSEENVHDINFPCVIQQFINHNSILYKVAAVGHRFFICERPSVKNLQESTQKTVYFDSMTVSKRNIHNKELHDHNPQNMKFKTSISSEVPLLDEDVIIELMKRITSRLGLTLFGVDIIVDEKTGNYGIIDLNYLPSYDGVLPQFARDLYCKLQTVKADKDNHSKLIR